MGQGGCERRIEDFVKFQKKKDFFWGGEGVGGGGVRVDVNEELKFLGKFKKKNGGEAVRLGGGGQDGCERRIEVFVRIRKKNWGGGGSGGGVGGEGGREGRVWGVRVDVIEEFKFLGKFTKKKNQAGVGFGSSGWGVRVDVNQELKFL